ncbi:MAG TPA: metal ABC transporter ATP-binding protein [Bryobacteraceae bacterium]|nr:metal ABC transporter ATP-binding protein [Bryobacteraceae bacterium]
MPAELNSILEVHALKVTFDERTVLSGLDFTVSRGEALAIIGPNGSGKTVLFRALIGAIPYQGTIRWASGVRLGYVPQKIDIERDLPITGKDLLRAKLNISGAKKQDILRALERLDLNQDALRQPIGSMSGGQFQRLLVAFALIGHPDVLLLDEPAAGIDLPGQDALNTALYRLQKEDQVTILLISHDLSVVYRYASKVLCLAREHICLGEPRVVLTPERLSELYGKPISFHSHDDGL